MEIIGGTAQAGGIQISPQAIGILEDIKKGANDDRLLSRHKLMPKALAEQCRLLVESGNVDHLLAAFSQDPKQLSKACRSAEMRKQVRHAERTKQGLALNGVERTRPEPV